MTDWKACTIKDIGEVIGGGTPSTKSIDFWNGDIVWLTPKDMSTQERRGVNSSSRLITEKGLQGSSAKILPIGSVLFTSRAPIGYLGISEVELSTNQGFKSIVPNHNISNMWLYYWLKNKTPYLQSLGSGSTFAEISGNTLKEVEILIPSLPEQKAIAEVLSALDDKIELLQKQNETLEALAQTLFRQWFIEDADDSWEEVEISKELTITIGKTPPRKESHWFSNTEGIPWLSIKDMGQQGIYINNTTEYLTKEAVDTHNVRVVPAESVLMSFKLTVGRVAINHQEMVTNEAIAHFYGFEQSRLSNYYVYLFLKQFNFRTLGSTSSIAQAVNSKTVKSIKIPVPHSHLMAEFTNNVEGLFEKIKLNTAQIQTLEQTRDTLLPKLMSGQVRVKLD